LSDIKDLKMYMCRKFLIILLPFLMLLTFGAPAQETDEDESDDSGGSGNNQQAAPAAPPQAEVWGEPGPASAPAASPANTGEMVSVPAGEFGMGCYGLVDGYCESEEWPYHKVYLDQYQIDKYEVTVAQYEDCVRAGACPEPERYSASDKWAKSCNYGNADRRDHPINCVIWQDADSYCKWAGKRLPTEAQWEKAARGTDGRAYPWGNTPPSCEYAVLPLRGPDSKPDEHGCGRASTWPVGSKPLDVSTYGVMDMAGNVSEWVVDWYDRGSSSTTSYYQNSPAKNPTGPATGKMRISRGASWNFWAMTEAARTSARHYQVPGAPDDRKRKTGVGFRCVR